jgi:hypothetical protein
MQHLHHSCSATPARLQRMLFGTGSPVSAGNVPEYLESDVELELGVDS